MRFWNSWDRKSNTNTPILSFEVLRIYSNILHELVKMDIELPKNITPEIWQKIIDGRELILNNKSFETNNKDNIRTIRINYGN